MATDHFRMSKARIVALRRWVHGRKGLDQETYRDHLQAVGATSTTTLTREQHDALVKQIGKLPDRPRQGRAAR